MKNEEVKMMRMEDIGITEEYKSLLPHADKIRKSYDDYRKFGVPHKRIVVDAKGVLIEGYTCYLISKMFGVEEIEVCLRAVA